MEGDPDPQGLAVRRLRTMAAAVVLVLAALVGVLVSGLPQVTRQDVTLVTLTAGGVVAALGFRRRVVSASGRLRRAYALFATACVLAAVSNVLQLGSPRTGAPGEVMPGDLVLTLALAVGVVGMLQLPITARRTADLTVLVLDGIVIGGSILLVAAVTLFPDLLSTDPGRWPILLVPVTDVVIATLATLLYLRSRRDHLMVGLLALAFYCFAVSDFGFAFVTGSGRLFTYGSLLDVGWLAGYLLIVLAIWAPERPAPAVERVPEETSPVVGTAVMFALFLAALGITLAAFNAERVSAPSLVLLLLVVLAVLARQLLLGIDNDHLRRLLEARVRERTRSLRQVTAQTDVLVEAVGEGIYGVDSDGLVTFANPATARALGYDADELIGRHAHATFHSRGPDGRVVPTEQCYVSEAVREGRVSTSTDDAYVRSDGRVVPVEVTATPLVVEDEVIGAVVIFRDVTQRREVDRLKTEFVSMVSHELRTPLTAIQGSLGLISGGALGPLPTAAARMLEIASISAHRLNRLVDDILDIERIESGVLVLEPGWQSARAVVDAAIAQLQVLAVEAGVEVVVDHVEGAVHADPDRVVQTLINLIGNALKFSYPGGQVVVSARPDEAFVEFAVRDQGRGIPPDRLHQIFNRFEQVDSSDAREKGGFGLGLAISKSLVERSGGRIWATSNPDRGSTFHFTLPRSGDTEPPPTTDSEESTVSTEPEHEPARA